MKKRKVKMIFEVIVPYDIMVDDEALKNEFGGKIKKVAEFLYKEEGNWWDEEMKLKSAEII